MCYNNRNIKIKMLDIAVKPYSEQGVIRPRLVARSLQIAKLLDRQRVQMACTNNVQTLPAIPYQEHAYLIGALLYFMIDRIDHCQTSKQCDPNKASLFHWFHDTLWRTYEQTTDQARLKAERGGIVDFFSQKAHSFADAVGVLQELNPYDFVVYPLPEVDHFVTQHVPMVSREQYVEYLKQLEKRYEQDGMNLMKLFTATQQKMSLRLLLRGMITMRTIVRGVGEAAMANQDYETAVRSFQFSGDLTQSGLQQRFQKIVNALQNEHPERCEIIMTMLEQGKYDWFNPFAVFYQGEAS